MHREIHYQHTLRNLFNTINTTETEGKHIITAIRDEDHYVLLLDQKTPTIAM